MIVPQNCGIFGFVNFRRSRITQVLFFITTWGRGWDRQNAPMLDLPNQNLPKHLGLGRQTTRWFTTGYQCFSWKDTAMDTVQVNSRVVALGEARDQNLKDDKLIQIIWVVVFFFFLVGHILFTDFSLEIQERAMERQTSPLSVEPVQMHCTGDVGLFFWDSKRYTKQWYGMWIFL